MSGGLIKLKGFSSSTPSSSNSSARTASTKTPKTPATAAKTSKGPAKKSFETPSSSKTRTKAETPASDGELDESFRIPLTPSARKDLEPALKKGGLFLQRYNDSSYYYEAKVYDVITPKDGPIKYKLTFTGWPKKYNKTITAEAIFKTCRVWTEKDAKIAKEDVKRGEQKSRRSSKGGEHDTTALKKDVEDDVEDSERHAKPSKTASDIDALRRQACYTLINHESVFPPKNTVDKVFKEYAKKLTDEKRSLFANPYYDAEMVVNIFLPSVEKEFNTHLPFCLTSKELTEWFTLLNAKRASLDLPPVDMKDYRDGYMADEKSKRTPLPELMVSMLDSFDILYFVRFVKRFYERANAIMEKGEENRPPVDKSPIKDLFDPLLKDILNFIDNTIDMESYDMD